MQHTAICTILHYQHLTLLTSNACMALLLITIVNYFYILNTFKFYVVTVTVQSNNAIQ